MTAELDKIEEEIVALRSKKSAIVREQLEKYKEKEVLDLLKAIAWSCPRYPSYVLYATKTDEPKYVKIMDYLNCRSWHFKEVFYDGEGAICFNDDEFSIEFKSEESKIRFVQENNLKLDLSDLRREVKDAELKIEKVRAKIKTLSMYEKTNDKAEG